MKYRLAHPGNKRSAAAHGSVSRTHRAAHMLGVFVLMFALVAQTVVPAQPAAASGPLMVTNTHDSGPGSLREAIQIANKQHGLDTINFHIPDSGPHTIHLHSALPTIKDPVIIDGYSQPGASPNTQPIGSNAVLLIELDGSAAGNNASGLRIRAGASTIRGLVINRFKKNGIVLMRDGGNVIEGNYIGTDVAGMTDLGNELDGITINNTGHNTIERNLISGNGRHGVRLADTRTEHNHIRGNYIGTDVTGSTSLGNEKSGVRLNKSSHNTIGGTASGAGNVISGNHGAGIHLWNHSKHNTIQGNTIGIDATGTAGLPNDDDGVYLNKSSHNIIGGTTSGAGNLIACNHGSGIRLWNDSEHNTIQGNAIGTDATGTAYLPNDQYGIQINKSDNNAIGGNPDGGNRIAYNGLTGVSVDRGTGNAIRANHISENGGLGIDLDTTGVTDNDKDDADKGANDLQNFPRLVRAYTNDDGHVVFEGFLNSSAEASFELDFFASPTCDASGHGEGASFLGSESVIVDGFNLGRFQITLDASVSDGQAVTATATDAHGNTSEFSQCILLSAPNDGWPDATVLHLTGGPPTYSASIEQFLDVRDQARWIKFEVYPNSEVVVKLDHLPANYDLIVYKAIAQAASETPSSDADLLQMSAETPDDAFNPDELATNALEPQTLFPEAYDATSLDVANYSSAVIAPHARSPHARSPHARSPHARSPDDLSQGNFNPAIDLLDGDAFNSAQSRTILGVSALNGKAAETVVVNTGNNTGFFYARVKGRNGAFDVDSPFRLTVTLTSNGCEAVQPISTPSNTHVPAGDYETIIVTDLDRMEGSSQDKADLQSRLEAFAARPEVKGSILDVGHDTRVAAARAQAHNQPGCPYAVNLVAEAIKEIIDRAREDNPLAYVVLVGNDDVIPFFRYPDQSPLGGETDYEPPVQENTTSEASLRQNYMLGQDAYGSQIELSLKVGTLPIPELPVGRLTETASDVLMMLDAYLDGTQNGLVPTPSTALVTGYDFLADAAFAIRDELAAGVEVDTLIADPELSFRDPSMWSARDLRALLLQNEYDLMYLAGHFSANSALAADYRTFVGAEEVAESTVDMRNAIVFSNGCHSGYNIVNDHGIPNVTIEPDWAQAFAQKGATLIAGTGYQFGDTDLLEYGERLYRDFSRELRSGSGPVSVGQALINAKQSYLASKIQIEGIDSKTVVIATLFGFPMMQIDMPGQRLSPATASTAAASAPALNPASAGTPGGMLGLQSTDVSLDTHLTVNTEQFFDVRENRDLTLTYLSGSAGTVVKPSEPILPLEILDLTQPDTVLRGVVLREAEYSDTEDIRPMLGAPATEIRGAQFTFPTDVFYPVKTWFVNYFGALSNPGSGETRLLVTPAQYISSAPGAETGTLRQFGKMKFRAYYNDNTDTYDNNTPATSAAPSIARVFASSQGKKVDFEAVVTGNPAAGIEAVSVLYTATTGKLYGKWQSLDLAQNSDESTLWEGSLQLPNNVPPDKVRYIVFAVNGVGMVSVDENVGAYHIPDIDPAAPPAAPNQQPGTLALVDNPPTSGPVGTQATFTALLESNGTPLPNEQVTFSIGADSRVATTDSDGKASVTFLLANDPGTYEVGAIFEGTPAYAASSAAPLPFEITTQATTLAINPAHDTIETGEESNIVATLSDAAGTTLRSKFVYFIVSGNGETYTAALPTDPIGQVRLGMVPLPAGTYTVEAYFSGSIPLPTGTIERSDSNYEPAEAVPATLTITDPPMPSCYAENQTVWTYAPGTRKNGSDIASNRTNPDMALGLPQDDDSLNFVSLGFGGTLVLEYNNVIINGTGADIRIWETSFDDQNRTWSAYPEAVNVEVSQDGTHWVAIGTTSDKDEAYDLGSLAWARFVRLTDVTDPAHFGGSADGFDVDAIEVLSSCAALPQ